jgi:hypothetical protein
MPQAITLDSCSESHQLICATKPGKVFSAELSFSEHVRGLDPGQCRSGGME